MRALVGLLDPLTVKGLELKNRLVMAPMAREHATSEGEVTDATVEHYTRRARGVGLVITEHIYVERNGRLANAQPGIYDDRLIPGLSRLVKAVHAAGAPIAIQVNHAGKRTSSTILGKEPVAPSPLPSTPGGEKPRELSPGEIGGLVSAFVEAARRAVEAGFDAVEIHGAHGFLLNQFASPLTNHRPDQYGGSLANRMRFPLEVVKRVRVEVGGGFPILYRLGADDRMAGGLTIEEGKRIAQMLVGGGVDVVDVSGGLCGSRPPDLDVPGFFVPLAEEIKRVIPVPVVGVGKITTAPLADEVVRKGRVDLVAVGRALLNDPDWAVKAVGSLMGSPR